MRTALKNTVKAALKKFDVGLVRHQRLEELKRLSKLGQDLELMMALPAEQRGQLIAALPGSRAQLRQDLFVLSQVEFKRGGYFVEFGATDGLYLSNTHLLEREFAWKGILAEPARRWHDALRKNRNCHVETDCVWRDSNTTLTFNETDDGKYSTIDAYGATEAHARARKQGQTYTVQTISLNDLLDKYEAPREMEYLSIDTEGSEYEILSSLDFDRHSFKVITVEHNFEPRREQLHALLTGKGYVRKLERQSTIDDWYVRVD